ncbi:MAG: hypothetical protein OK452_06990 [Thaumarchaeota archaeon]|nr:hypothetical protein [Nitrososphaerota archaeon]
MTLNSSLNFRNVGSLLSLATEVGILSYVMWAGKLVLGGSRPLLTQPCDLVSAQQLTLGSISALGLAFPRFVLGIAPSFSSLSSVLVVMGIVSASLMVVGVFVFSSTLSRDTRFGLLSSIVSLAVLSATGAFQSAEYPFLAGLAFSFMALAIVFGSGGAERLWPLPIASIPALLASLFDAYWGLIIFFAVLGTDLLQHRTWARPTRNLWSTVAMTPALVISVLTLILLKSVPSVPFQVNLTLLVVLAAAAAWGGAALVLKSRHPTIAGVFPLVGASLVAGIISSPQYSVIPLSVLGTLAVTNMGSKTIVVERSTRYRLVGNTRGSDVYDIDIDFMKLLSAVFVLLLLASSVFLGSLPFAQSLQQQRADVNTFGTSQASDALSWIRSNTTSSATIAAPQAFSNWVDAYTGRGTLFGRIVCPAAGANSTQADTLDLLYNSNVELRNEYLSLRDGTPYSTAQTPSFSVSNGSSFAEVLYTTDAYNRIGFSYAGHNWTEAPYLPNSFQMTSSVNASSPPQAGVKMKFTTASLTIVKTMALVQGSNQAQLSYSIASLRPVVLHSMNVTFWIPSSETTGNLTRSGDTVQLPLNNRLVVISSSAAPVNVSLKSVGGQGRLLLQYVLTGESFSITLRLTFSSAVKSSWSGGVIATTSDEVISSHHVSYVLVPVSSGTLQHLRADLRFVEAYSNERIVIFSVKAIAGP